MKNQKQSKSTKVLSDGLYDLMDVGQIGTLNRDFTAAIIDLQRDEIDGREAEVFELIANDIHPLLITGSFFLVKATSKTCSVVENAFTKSGFKFRNMLIHEDGGFFVPWLIFQLGKENADELSAKSHKRVLDYRRSVFSRKQSELETRIYSGWAPEMRFTPQSLLRSLIKMLCPNRKTAKVLVPYYTVGNAIAACKSLGIRSVGYTSNGHSVDEDELLSTRVMVERLVKA
jgi:hypothetical protein